MKGDDVTKLSELELMRRIAALLPAEDLDRADLLTVEAGLSTPDAFAMVNGELTFHTDYILRARALFAKLLPRLAVRLGDEPLVRELCARYPTTPRN